MRFLKAATLNLRVKVGIGIKRVGTFKGLHSSLKMESRDD
jgi:hypothetical protein